jgi:xyloglucan-specific endo-beta-1,4-glucanase
VHSFAHVKFQDKLLPLALANITSLQLSAEWSMGPGSAPRPVPGGGFDLAGLNEIACRANAAFDLFADPNPEVAGVETKAQTEIMVWLGLVGNPWPLRNVGDGDELARVMLGTVELSVFVDLSSVSWVFDVC